MVLEELTILAAGYWLAESQIKEDSRRMGWERIAALFRDLFDLTWQVLLLYGFHGMIQQLSANLPQAQSVALGGTMILAYGLSLVRRRPEGAAELYFLALMVLALALQQVMISSGAQFLGIFARLLGGSLACEVILVGLHERLRWSPIPNGMWGLPSALLCLSMLAIIAHSFGF